MKFRFLFFIFYFPLNFAFSQIMREEEELISRLNVGSDLPKDLLAARSVVFFQATYTTAELETIQKYFQQAGIDAVAYIDFQRVLSGMDPSRAYVNYLNVRKIPFLILLRKTDKMYECIITEFSGNAFFTDKAKLSWKQSNASLLELLQTIYRFSVSTLKRKNYLINDLPETNIDVANFKGKHNDRFSFEVKSFKTAIPKFSSETDNAQLETYVKENLPIKYDFVDPTLSDAELLQKGYRIVLRFVHAPGDLAREILGYEPTQPNTSLATNYFSEGESKIKTITAKKIIYKFYFKNLEYGDMFLGKKWDADETWQDALKNHIDALRADQKF